MPYLLSCPLSWDEEDSENRRTLHKDSLVLEWEKKCPSPGALALGIYDSKHINFYCLNVWKI